ncbi:HlyD family efflux transporter periplasmic adaptor subunit [Novosphingobium sp. YJ-S2-02]|uniref:HlyD family efflux transporter periplasmic adaptor subunit n=1 Tax=Novosphingobium aureum TaxID=2792964 RepID=A0A931MKP3_9SPHN|nr:HlyD family efflux transporter periplasmic adaptor subunit [Novosphingobium aureum]MBH0112674.1 HlyD family efflux transporter periplasmic adaptor subunit [Novosphingobium aureum]
MTLDQDHLLHFPSLTSLRPPRVTVVVGWLIVLGIALSIAILFVPWLQTAQGPGQVTSLDPDDRPRQVSSLVSGRVDRFFVHDGEYVEAGDPIVRVVDVDPDFLTRLAAEKAQVEAQIAAVEQSRAVASIDVGRTRQLLAEGLAARRDYEQTQIKVADAEAKLAEARAKLKQIEVQLNRQSAQIVPAPRSGRVQQLNAAAGGALISAGTVLATIAPEEIVRAVEIYVDGRDIPLVEPGRAVRLEFEGFPAIQFSGWPSFALGIYDGRVRTVDPTPRADGLFRVLVEPQPGAHPWPDQRFIRQGSKVLGWIQGDQVTVGYELWRQLNDFPLNFGQQEAAAAYYPKPAEGGSSSSDKK